MTFNSFVAWEGEEKHRGAKSVCSLPCHWIWSTQKMTPEKKCVDKEKTLFIFFNMVGNIGIHLCVSTATEQTPWDFHLEHCHSHMNHLGLVCWVTWGTWLSPSCHSSYQTVKPQTCGEAIRGQSAPQTTAWMSLAQARKPHGWLTLLQAKTNGCCFKPLNCREFVTLQ